MNEFLLEYVVPHINYWIYVVLMMMGMWAMIAKQNLIKKLMGMAIFQTAIILFWVSIGVKDGSTIPILTNDDLPNKYGYEKIENQDSDYEQAEGDSAAQTVDKQNKKATAINPDAYANPLPHVLMLTAIVVGVATLGLGLAIAQKVYKQYGTIEEREILAKIQEDPHREDAVQPEGYGGSEI